MEARERKGKLVQKLIIAAVAAVAAIFIGVGAKRSKK